MMYLFYTPFFCYNILGEF